MCNHPKKVFMWPERQSHIAEEEVEMTSQATSASIYDSEKVSILHNETLYALPNKECFPPDSTSAGNDDEK